MTTKHFLTMASLAIAGLFTFSSCDDDEAEYHAPVYKTITFSPNPCYPGDKVTATVSYSKKGENWYYYMQRFTLDGHAHLTRQQLAPTPSSSHAVLLAPLAQPSIQKT